MSFSLGTFLPTLQKGLDFVTGLTDALPQGIKDVMPEVVGKAAQIGGAILETAVNINDRVQEGRIVASSDDQEQLKSILERIRDENDKLRRYIAEH